MHGGYERGKTKEKTPLKRWFTGHEGSVLKEK
jgi:hypothetical protein